MRAIEANLAIQKTSMEIPLLEKKIQKKSQLNM